jgi:hypothetical protein
VRPVLMENRALQVKAVVGVALPLEQPFAVQRPTAGLEVVPAARVGAAAKAAKVAKPEDRA